MYNFSFNLPFIALHFAQRRCCSLRFLYTERRRSCHFMSCHRAGFETDPERTTNAKRRTCQEPSRDSTAMRWHALPPLSFGHRVQLSFSSHFTRLAAKETYRSAFQRVAVIVFSRFFLHTCRRPTTSDSRTEGPTLLDRKSNRKITV